MADTEVKTKPEKTPAPVEQPAVAVELPEYAIRVRVQSAAGSESVTVVNPTVYDLTQIVDATARLIPADIGWQVGSAHLVPEGADQDTIDRGDAAVAMVVRWTQ